MQTLRHAHLLARLVLVWFVCALGVAVASPMVPPQAMELVCSSGGAVKLLVKTDNGVQEMGAHSLDCPLCLVGLFSFYSPTLLITFTSFISI